MKALILAGGSGTRLWPLSRRNFPKQFLKLNGEKSLLRQTVERLLGALSFDDIVVMTNSEYKFYVKSDLREIKHIILEPEGRNTAPAIALGIKYCMEKLGCSEEEVLFVFPSDHVIRPVDQFMEYVKFADGIAKQGRLVTFGIKPDRPETGYGYIKASVLRQKSLYFDCHSGLDPESSISGLDSRFCGNDSFGTNVKKCWTHYTSRQNALSSKQQSGQIDQRNEINQKAGGAQKTDLPAEALAQAGYFSVEKFVEKPDEATAREYLEDGHYYWNSGMFAFNIRTMVEEFEKYSPRIRKMLEMNYDEMARQFSQMPDISIDYAIMEKSERVAMLPLDIYWNDIGSWDSLHDLLSQDEDGNAAIGDVMTLDTKNCLIYGNKRLLSTIGLKDCLIVETDDAVLVAKKGEAWKVREIVNRLKEGKRKEAIEHVTTYRPWGSYTVLEQGPRYKIKRVVVNPGEKLSLQTHAHRSEHWVVVKGTAKVSIGDKEVIIHENESAYVPKSTLHRLENGGKIPVEIIEVQNGEYVEEDDIERFDDSYGR